MKEKHRNYFLFIRISEEKYIDSLQKQGQIYCNPIQYFRSIEDEHLQGDKNEGKAYIKQIKNLEISLEGKVIAKANKGQLYFEHPEDDGNIYCLYGVESKLVDLTKKSLQKIKIEEQAKGFGKYALLIHDPQEFLNRISQKLNSLDIKYNFHPVNYYDVNSYEGGLNPFYKSNMYRYQNEVRLWIANKNKEPFEFFIGDISDITHKMPISDLDKLEVEMVSTINNNDYEDHVG
ncbi:MAG: hypothetical protein IPJ74_20205 [Saprospiraceae bacterium]|nr:hypothetical protein [Saprospiraceae bacterium]